jgi:D-serine deaminase-like pyridoxal phosphate-dependent protein
MKNIYDLPTPALVIDAAALEKNLATMAAALPGSRLRPHVKAHKCTELAKRQRAHGHTTFACATMREVLGMAAAGLGDDLLLANEVLDASPLSGIDARVTLAVDSDETVVAAANAGIREVLIDVNVGLPRCGCPPKKAGRLADFARSRGLTVRGVMGYEGHAVTIKNRFVRRLLCAWSMRTLRRAHADVGGDTVSAGGTGTYAHNDTATEIQAGSYALMDNAYAKYGFPFERAAFVLATVISTNGHYAVANAGLKCFGMDHGKPTIDNGRVWIVSDEHTTFTSRAKTYVGDLVRLWPSHIDPTVAYHERAFVIDGENVVDEWPIDLRGW